MLRRDESEYARPPVRRLGLVPLGRALVAAGSPVPRGHGPALWTYSVTLGLDDEPVRSRT
ncbi:hypothetical protein [Streptomyces glomeratus]|uniref:Uncharacterized protein n=1 Tax=Streptomyces glomeratus TaxID=284452 RepID=A0ABP6LUR3_9ACTN|nr:hypothetical protein [Streptomyces glomeratus]MCF1510906.1 hypothetical protein [Streptomyces glomeratus]